MKKIIALSSIAFLSTAVFAAADADAKIAKLEKKVKKLQEKVSEVNALAAKDNLKFDVDFRTAADNVHYTTLSGKEYGTGKDALLSNRLWLGMGYAPADNILFRGQLSMHKAFGASASMINSDGNTVPQRGYGYDAFDWVNNENLADGALRVREAYWLYKDTIGGLGVTASVGRRPATNGFLANLREDDANAKSPMGHVINMEFDGASASVSSDAILPGMMFKLCLGRGLTNANARFTTTNVGASIDYANDRNNAVENVDMAGFIFVPYNDGQYKVMTTWYRGFNVPGMQATGMQELFMDHDADPLTAAVGTGMYMPTGYAFASTGGAMDGAAISLQIDGIGDGISDFLDNTTVFGSFAQSKTHPEAGGRMLGSTDSETGTSYWIGTQMPNMTGGKFGLEYNHGSENWRSFTYGEDTMAGSKMAARGSAIEAYWTQPLISDIFSMQIRYTRIDYDYTGSNSFFGDGGMAMSMADVAQANMLLADTASNPAFGGMQMDPVETAQDIRVYFRYRY